MFTVWYAVSRTLLSVSERPVSSAFSIAGSALRAMLMDRAPELTVVVLQKM